MTTDLSTFYLKQKLKNPLVVSACPLTGSIKSLQELEEAGAAAVVLQSLFTEQIEHEENEMFRLHSYSGDSSAETAGYFPELENYNAGPEPYLDFLEKAKHTIRIPIIGSLNGTAPGKWLRFARLYELAGADALELNIYFVPTNPMTNALEVEKRYIDIVSEIAAIYRSRLPLRSDLIFRQFPILPSGSWKPGPMASSFLIAISIPILISIR